MVWAAAIGCSRCRDDPTGVFPARTTSALSAELARENIMPWLLLVIAGLLEICWALGMKQSDGFSRLWPTLFTWITMLISFWLLALAMKSLPASTAYAVWTGIGVAGVAVAGAWWASEGLGPGRWLCIAMIAAGSLGLKLLE